MTLPETEKGLQVVREWVRDFFYTASWSELGRQAFLSAIAETMTLALMLERGGAQTYFVQARCIISDKPVDYLRQGNRYIVQDLMAFLCRNDNTALSAGVLFIK